LAIHDINFSAKQILRGNILLILCCAFYLAWWLLAFKPTGAIKGMKTGWLLLPAFILGVSAVILAAKGISSAGINGVDAGLFPGRLLLYGGILAYFILWAVTVLIFKRPVTTELFLIVGWALLSLSEINTLYGVDRFSHGQAVLFVIIIGVATLINLVCYVLYYNLGTCLGYFDGMVPLLMAALVMAGISVTMVI
jgi:hypothetical protein